MTWAPAGIVTPPSSTGSTAYRNVECGTGASKRRNSSNAVSSLPGSRRSSGQLIGVAEQGDDAVADEARGRVVPGDDQLEDRRAAARECRGAPSPSRAAIKALDEIVARMRGSCPRRAFPADATTMSDERLASAYCSGVEVGTSSPIRPMPRAARSGSGTPSSSQMTVNGSGNAKRETRSTRLSAPSAAMSSSRSSTMAWMRGRRSSMRRGEKALETSRRSRVWSGGSTVSMCRANAGPGRPSDTTAAFPASAACMSFDSRRDVERGAGLIVVNDEPGIVAVVERHWLHSSSPAHVGEQCDRGRRGGVRPTR